MQPHHVALQHAGRQGPSQPAEGLARSRPYAPTHEGAYRLMADVPSSDALEQGELCMPCNGSLCMLESEAVKHVVQFVDPI